MMVDILTILMLLLTTVLAVVLAGLLWYLVALPYMRFLQNELGKAEITLYEKMFGYGLYATASAVCVLVTMIIMALTWIAWESFYP